MKNDKATTEESSGDGNGERLHSLGAALCSVRYAVRVITWPHHPATADDDIKADVEAISNRYRELSLKLSFMESAEIAKAEWLTRFLSQNVES